MPTRHGDEFSSWFSFIAIDTAVLILLAAVGVVYYVLPVLHFFWLYNSRSFIFHLVQLIPNTFLYSCRPTGLAADERSFSRTIHNPRIPAVLAWIFNSPFFGGIFPDSTTSKQHTKLSNLAWLPVTIVCFFQDDTIPTRHNQATKNTLFFPSRLDVD